MFFSQRSYSAYRDAISRLNTLQTGFNALSESRLQNQSLTSYQKQHRLADVLPRMRQWLASIGLKPKDISDLKIIHVAGTNGKGSTCSYMERALTLAHQQYGWPATIGMYTSPHLMSVRERIRLNGRPISEPTFIKYFNEVYEQLRISQHPMPGYFRFLTLLSFYVFVKEGVDVALIETGVGGEYDSTNVIDHPVISVITSIGKDHQMTLGDDIAQIAWHKGGIFKAGALALTIDQDDTVRQVLEHRAIEKGAHLSIIYDDTRLNDVSLPQQQVKNCSLALAATEKLLSGRLPFTSFSKTIVHQIARTRWPGRFEVVQKGRIDWCLDGAHNEQGLRAAVDWLSGLIEDDQNCVIMVIFNQESQRNTEDLLRGFHSELVAKRIDIKHIVFCTNRLSARELMNSEDLKDFNKDEARTAILQNQTTSASVWRQLSPSSIAIASTIEEAMESARAMHPALRVKVLVTGSLRIVGGALHLLADET